MRLSRCHIFFGDSHLISCVVVHLLNDSIHMYYVFLECVYNCSNWPTAGVSNAELAFTVETKCLSVSFKVKITLLYSSANCQNKVSAKIKSTGIPQWQTACWRRLCFWRIVSHAEVKSFSASFSSCILSPVFHFTLLFTHTFLHLIQIITGKTQTDELPVGLVSSLKVQPGATWGLYLKLLCKVFLQYALASFQITEIVDWDVWHVGDKWFLSYSTELLS